MTRTNWSDNVTYTAERVVAPTSLDQLSVLVASGGGRKALGTRHCFHDIADTPGGVQVRVDDLGFDVEVDHEAMTAVVPAGWSYGRVARALEAEGVALHNLGSLPHISVAGATATGTHGSGDTNRMLAAAIVGIELVTAAGDVRTFGADHPDLPALATGLGAFGVITRLTLAVEPSYRVWQEMWFSPSWDELFADFDAVMAGAYSVNLHVGFSEPRPRLIWRKCRVGVDDADPPASIAGARLVEPADIPPNENRTEIGTVGPWCDRLAHFRLDGVPSVGGDELQSEWFVAREHAVDAIEALRAMGERLAPHLYGSEIRTVAADDLWLSPAHGLDCLSIGLTWRKHPEEVAALQAPIEAALEPFSPRAHWGKLFALDADVLRSRYERYDDFVELVHRYDPDGRFANPFLRRLGVW